MAKKRTVRVYTADALENAKKLEPEAWRKIKHFDKVQMAAYIQSVYMDGFQKGFELGRKEAGKDAPAPET
ncbi:MAG: hypothetical protein J5633_04655 [Oscillospiraceae bacterium]|nr:hypothetical protein [Oscillospiraceae bacterium]